MGAFEHVISLLSFVFALAITHLLLTVAGLIRGWERVRISGPHALWLVIGLVTVIADWISFWDMRALPAWSVGTIFFVFALAFVNYLQVALVCPDIPPEGPIDLTGFHEAQSRRYIGGFVASGVMALLANTIYGAGFNVSEWSVQNLAVIPMTLAALPAMIWRGRFVQLGSPVLVLAAWIFYFAELQGALH
jgi:hypothetical protein